MDTQWTRLNQVFQDIFEDDDIQVNENTTAADIEEWDSMKHVSLMLAVEREFSIRFSASEIAKLATVGELVDLINSKAT